MLPVVCALLLFCGGALASPVANQYIDNVLYTAFQNEIRSHGLEPAFLSNFNTEFKDKVKIIGNVKVSANYTEGKLSGLSRVQRFSDCSGPLYSFGATTINCTLAFNFLNVDYKVDMKYGKLPKVPVKAHANVTTSLVNIEVARFPQNPVTTLKVFQFVQAGQIKPIFTGLGSTFNKYLKMLEDGFLSHVGAQVFNSITQNVPSPLQRAVSQVPMPQF